MLAKDHEEGNIQEKKHFLLSLGCDKEAQNDKAAKINARNSDVMKCWGETVLIYIC